MGYYNGFEFHLFNVISAMKTSFLFSFRAASINDTYSGTVTRYATLFITYNGGVTGYASFYHVNTCVCNMSSKTLICRANFLFLNKERGAGVTLSLFALIVSKFSRFIEFASKQDEKHPSLECSVNDSPPIEKHAKAKTYFSC